MAELNIDPSTFHSCGEVKTVNVNGIPLACWHVEGGENTLVFLHGNSAAKEVFYKQMSFFAEQGYSLLAIDLPGHGQSGDAASDEIADETYTIPAYARAVTAILDAFNITKPLLVGWSLGGHIAIEMKGQNVSLAGICIMGTPPLGPGFEEFEQAFLPSPLAEVTTKAVASEAEIIAYAKGLYGSACSTPEFFIDAALRTDGRARARMGEHWASAVDGHKQRAVVGKADTPTLVFHGDQDKFISSAYMDTVEWGNLWGGNMHRQETVGHAPFFEAPKIFNATLHIFAQCVFP
ncbi:MAG: alpha/beta hydrolase [Kordiimonadaceae bacterium]|nr:alpha/beta hydrolase [Kordiimonadaceae bacterium]